MGILNDINNNLERSWIDQYKKPFIISGPCSAENEKQVLNTANQLNQLNIQAFRSGIWKPRTKPGNFEGVGEEGLKWLNKVKKENQCMIATEVANAEHVRLCISYDVDILWIGARTTTSPFAIQDIADVLEGDSKRIILIKNPIHPDIELWMGALERFYNKGIKKLGLIHRGFYSYKSVQYRNQPNWKFLLDIKNSIPRIPILCDPSHICGNREGILDISRKAYHYFKCEGFMIESHFDPKNAWSDANQQVDPNLLSNILKKITLKIDGENQKNIKYLRILIDELDDNILSLLSNRMNISKELGILKKNFYMDVLQPERWVSIMNRSIKLGKKLNLSEDFLKKLFKLLHQESIEIQNKMRS